MKETFLISIIIFLGALIALFIYNDKKKKKKQETHHIGGEPLSKNEIPNLKLRAKTVNFVDANSSASGIIEAQKKQEKQAEESFKKPIGWVPATSYEEDVRTTNIVKYVHDNSPNSNENGQQSSSDKKKLNVLVVDDSITVLKLVGTLLAKANYNFVTKENGVTALDYLNESNTLPDLIITDIEMPVMNGVELIKSLRAEKRFANTPILILSSTPEPHIYLLQEELINGIIRKPFDREDFMNQIKFVLQ